MGAGNSDRLADLLAALGEFAGRLGLQEADEAAIRREVDALRVHVLWRPDAGSLEAGLRRIRGILASAGDNRLARGAMAEIDSLLPQG
jgi:hypothetical protein